MSLVTHKIAPCLWFDSEAEQAANFYVSVFENSKINLVSRYGNEGIEIHGREPGSVMTVAFELDGQPFVALNGGPIFTFDEAVSFQIYCADQNEIDYYWTKLAAGGEEGPCGWLKDKFGLSWQVTPTRLLEMLTSGDTARADRVMKSFLQMKKFDLAELERVYAGN
jgi:predicted 3-demethylubiquinone-9 3-methyltransferase (glyoxalase superfamily)